MEIDVDSLIHALHGLVWTARPDGTAEHLGNGWLEYTGLQAQEAVGAGWLSAVHPEDRPRLRKRWGEITASGELGEVEARLRRSDGVYRWFLFRASPMPNPSGKVSRWCGMNIDIEDRKRAEEALLAQERRFQFIVEGLPAIIALFSPEGRLMYCNRQMLEYLDATFDEVRSKASAYNFHPDERDEVLAAWAASVQSGRPFDREARLQRADGVYRWHRTRVFPLRDPAGEIELWYGLSTDIEDTKRAEAELRQAHDFLSEAQQLSNTGSFTWDAETGEETWSEQLCRIFEIDPDTKITLPLVRQYVHPEDLPLLRATTEQAIAGEAPDYFFRIVTAQGAVKHLHCAGHRSDQISDRPVFIGAIQDVTESKRAEAALKASEEELRRAHAHLTEAQRLSRTGSFTWDVQADEHNWSEEIYRIFGLEPGSKVAMPIIQAAIHPEDVAAVEAVIGGALEGADFDLTFRVNASGAVRHLHVVGHHIAQIVDRLVFIGAIQDVTENKDAEAALSRARAELAHVARVSTLSALTASIAHEVNQPLAGIITNASTCLRMLAAEPPNIDGARATAQRTIRDGNRASEVVQRLRALFSRKTPSMEPVDLNDAAREVLALSSSDLQRRRVIVRTDFARDLPPVLGDRVQLQQVILNLVLNAADAMSEADSRVLRLTTAVDATGEVMLSARDSGVGIEPENLQRLFDTFYTTKAEGMGVGLSISRSIIQAHDGRLWADANDGPGMTFSFAIPRGSGQGAEPATRGQYVSSQA